MNNWTADPKQLRDDFMLMTTLRNKELEHFEKLKNYTLHHIGNVLVLTYSENGSNEGIIWSIGKEDFRSIKNIYVELIAEPQKTDTEEKMFSKFRVEEKDWKTEIFYTFDTKGWPLEKSVGCLSDEDRRYINGEIDPIILLVG